VRASTGAPRGRSRTNASASGAAATRRAGVRGTHSTRRATREACVSVQLGGAVGVPRTIVRTRSRAAVEGQISLGELKGRRSELRQ
jgi:hypothetical protein